MSDKINMSVDIAGVTLKNPITVASGTFGSGMEYSEFVDLSQLGAVTTKGVANVPWPGNPTPRVAEVYGGMMNAIGLQNPGIDTFVKGVRRWKKDGGKVKAYYFPKGETVFDAYVDDYEGSETVVAFA